MYSVEVNRNKMVESVGRYLEGIYLLPNQTRHRGSSVCRKFQSYLQ